MELGLQLESKMAIEEGSAEVERETLLNSWAKRVQVGCQRPCKGGCR